MPTKRTPRADGLFRVKIYLGKVEGKPKYKYVYGATEKEAELKADDARARMRKGLDVSAEREPFSIWADRWLRLKRADVGHSAYVSYQSCLKRLSPLNEIPISRITAYDIQEIIIDLAEKNPRTGKPTAKKTLSDIKNAAKQVLQLAVDNRVIDYNPALAVRIPRNAPKSERRALTDVEQQWIVSTPHRMQAAAMIMMYSGLRRGELIPLLWRDIDLEARTISVSKSVDLSRGKPILKDGAKTKAGVRVVDIPLVLADYLRGLDQSTELVCPGLSGEMYTVDSWKSAWDSYMIELDMLHAGPARNNLKPKKKRGTGDSDALPERKSRYDPRFAGVSIEPITPHMLRHTFCTLLYHAGVDVLSAQKQMGHADARTTLGIYTHLDSKHKRQQMTKLDDYLDNASRSK